MAVNDSTFRGSEASGAAVFVYSHADEPLLGSESAARRRYTLRLDSRATGVTNDQFRLVSVQTQKRIDGSAGTFSFVVKHRSTAGMDAEDFANLVVDDDWVDLVFTRNNAPIHVMRGTVDSIAPVDSVDASGATMRTYVVTGRDHTKIFQITPVWFDRITDGDHAGAALTRVISKTKGLAGDVAKTVKNLLYGFMTELGEKSRANWVLPPQLPSLDKALHIVRETSGPQGTTTKRVKVGETRVGGAQYADREVAGRPAVVAEAGASFIDVLKYDTSKWLNDPPRSACINPAWFDPQNTDVWSLAQTYADPALCEFYCDLVPADPEAVARADTRDQALGTSGASEGGIAPSNNTVPRNMVLAVILRDKPFLTKTRHERGKVLPDANLGVPEAVEKGPWFHLPRTVVGRKDCISIEVVRSGAERLNMFMAAPQIYQESLRAWPELQTPLISKDDVRRHGVRRFDAMTNYTATPEDSAPVGGSELGMARSYRARVRDFYCMNHLFYSGRVSLAHGSPSTRVGSKLVVKGASASEDLTFYVEEVTHGWQAAPGETTAGVLRSSFGVTRGWRGLESPSGEPGGFPVPNERTLLSAFKEITAQYNDDEVKVAMEQAKDRLLGRET